MGKSGGSVTKSSQTGYTTAQTRLDPAYSGDLRALLGQGKTLMNQRMGEQYPSLYSGLDPSTIQGLGMMERTAGAKGGSMVPGEALSEWQKTVSGKYLDPNSNKWLRGIADRSAMESENRINSQYATGGAGLGGSYTNSLADAQMEMRSQLYGGNYEAERGRMQGALSMAPSMEALQYADAGRLGMVGSAREADALAKATEANRQYNKPKDEMAAYAELLYGSPLQKELTMTENTQTYGKANQSNKFDWAAFVGGLLG